MSHGLLQLKQTLLILVLLHDHTGHFRTRELTRGRGQTGLNGKCDFIIFLTGEDSYVLSSFLNL